eukprot:scaffold66381_cov63-Phaeocystis_antarctica.AAC.12
MGRGALCSIKHVTRASRFARELRSRAPPPCSSRPRVGAVCRGREQAAADQSRDDLVVLGPAEAHAAALAAVGLAEGDVARGELVPEEHGAARGGVLQHGGHEQQLLEARRVEHGAQLGRGPQLLRRLVDVAEAHLLRARDLGKLRRQPAGLEGAPHIARDGGDLTRGELDAVLAEGAPAGGEALGEDDAELGVRVWQEVDAPDAQPRRDARHQPLGQVHRVGDGDDDQPACLRGPLEEVVDDLLLARHQIVQLVHHEDSRLGQGAPRRCRRRARPTLGGGVVASGGEPRLEQPRRPGRGCVLAGEGLPQDGVRLMRRGQLHAVDLDDSEARQPLLRRQRRAQPTLAHRAAQRRRHLFQVALAAWQPRRRRARRKPRCSLGEARKRAAATTATAAAAAAAVAATVALGVELRRHRRLGKRARPSEWAELAGAPVVRGAAGEGRDVVQVVARAVEPQLVVRPREHGGGAVEGACVTDRHRA